MSTTSDTASRPRSTSWLWQFFKKKEEGVAKCIMCNKLYSYKSTISNLKMHLDRSHPTLDHKSDYDEDTQVLDEEALELGEQNLDDSDYNPTEESKEYSKASQGVVAAVSRVKKRRERANISPYWKHFQKTAKGLALCLHCHTIKSYRSTTNNLRAHLKCKHPAVYRTMDQAPDTTHDGDRSLGDLGMLGAEIKNEPESLGPARKRPRSLGPVRKRPFPKREVVSPVHVYAEDWLSESVPEVISSTMNVRESRRDPVSMETDEVELFGKYVTAVLHKLPRGRACTVQTELMTVLMKAQMEHENTLNPEPSVVLEVTEEARDS